MLLLVAIGTLAIVGCTNVDPGHVGIEVDYYGKNRGVQDYTIVTGMVWFNPLSTSVFQWPTSVQTAVWTHSLTEGRAANEEISYNSSEGLVFTADISLSYRVVAEKVPAFYVKFRSSDLNAFTHGFLRNIARDAFNEVGVRHTADELYGAKKEDAIHEVRRLINDQVAEYGVIVEQFGYVGAPRPPNTVADAINSKIKAIQDSIRVENELRQETAQAQKTVAKAKGEAAANEILTASINESLIRWRQLDLTEKAVAKWNGQRPMVEGSASGLLLNVTPPANAR